MALTPDEEQLAEAMAGELDGRQTIEWTVHPAEVFLIIGALQTVLHHPDATFFQKKLFAGIVFLLRHHLPDGPIQAFIDEGQKPIQEQRDPSNADQEAVAEALHAVGPTTIPISNIHAYTIISAIQVAHRHPHMEDFARERLDNVADTLTAAIGGSAMKKAIALGWENTRRTQA
ncbi:hypothetical protein Pan216_30010 [Planctomycetes bacterium Pan216]|uniref:Uncharacterized protein n=1 Tax=Kolteria novifilia TaxID=2527975 RepID=A0A518B583_9BACT|nr:hypothetical protein Pan216_30010 [Planctomycetes bacterium Pan216]